ncbi:sulfotransferase [Rhizorhabdus wittichii]|uniref:Sulfotransferase n=1 Tax=Rhizorhabdus wittichii TaxID=160791 RepID=A0A975D2T0_9SPHN|nr:sulfotransferase [Rhizorhabdus wittichii]QTH21161.1 sulfotransferase [Rhizorhabdus wittichii]
MVLDAEDLKARARAETGLEDYGDAPLDESLGILCRSLREEARLTPEGVGKVETLIVSRLAERLRIEDFIERHPEVLEREVAPVVLLAGMPRSGTTAFAQHLSEDPAARAIPRWECNSLVPPETGAHSDADPRLARSRAAFEQAFKEMPWRQAILPNNYDDPAEHGILMGLTFLNLQLPTLYRVPSWEAWMMEQDLTPGYAYLARVLKLLQWAKPARFWSLKLPPDLFALDAIDRVFPGTRFVWSHRHPLESISSVCSLSANLREKQAGASVDPLEIGPTQLAFQAEACDRAMAARATIGEDRFIDVYQSDLSNDIPGTIEALYAKLGLPFTDAYRANLTARMAEKPRGRFGKHDHHLDRYGISERQVVDRFSVYIDRFHSGRD